METKEKLKSVANESERSVELRSRPLVEITAAQVVAARRWRMNFQAWPSRDRGANRVEPIAKPHFDTPFRLVPGENIFTIGSCFARHVESLLLDRGYRIPALDIFQREDFKNIALNTLNNYGVPSIYQELAWALDPAFPFDPAANFTEVVPGKFVDNHLPPFVRPASLEVVMARREAVRQATASVKDCRVVIITLGLTEVWYDKIHDVYINEHPRPRSLEAEPERFVLRVLSFDQTMDYLRRIVDVIAKFGRPDSQIIVTVSPVPLTSTHRPVDVMVANTYSKSVLRTAAEHIVAERDNVHYFPSYESIILSDRQRAYNSDMVHIEMELVDLNVGRMVSGFAGRDERADRMTDEDLLAHINEVSGAIPRLKWNLLVEHEGRIAKSTMLAVEYIETALSRKMYKHARNALARAPGPWAPAQKELLEGATLIGEKRFSEARALLQSLNFSRTEPLTDQGRRCFFLLIEANIGLKDMDAARDDAFVFSRDVAAGGRQHLVYQMLARGYKEAGRLQESAHHYARAIEVNQSDTVLVDYAEVLVLLKRWKAATAVLGKTKGDNAEARRRKEHLLSFVPVKAPWLSWLARLRA